MVCRSEREGGSGHDGLTSALQVAARGEKEASVVGEDQVCENTSVFQSSSSRDRCASVTVV